MILCAQSQSVEQVFDELLRLSPSELVLIDDEWHREHLAQWQKLGALSCRIEWRKRVPKSSQHVEH